jgi:hypothetical protein
MGPALQLKGKVAVSRQVTVNGIEVAASRKAQEEETSHHSLRKPMETFRRRPKI